MRFGHQLGAGHALVRAEVEDFHDDAAVGARDDSQVAGLDVPMNDAERVGFDHGEARLQNEAHRLAFR